MQFFKTTSDQNSHIVFFAKYQA